MKFVGYIVLMFLVLACDTSRNTIDPQENYFLRYYGQAGHQEAVDMVETHDGNYLLLGNSRITPDAPSQVYLVKVNQLGYVMSEKVFVASNHQIAKDIEPTTDGHYLILIDSVALTGTDIMVKIVDDEGMVSATSTHANAGNYNEIGNSVTQLLNAGAPAGFIVTGYTDTTNTEALKKTTSLKIRFNQDGTLYSGPWKNYDGAEGDDIGIRIIQRGDLNDENPFVFFGYSDSNVIDGNGSFNFWISEMDIKGEGAGSRALAGSSSNHEKLTGVISVNSTSSSTYALSGTVTDALGDDKIFVAGVTAAVPATSFFENSELTFDLGSLQSLNAAYQNVSITHLNSTGYLVAANQVLVDDTDILLIKLKDDGSLEWSEPVRFGGNGNDRQATVMESPDGRILLLGTMELGSDRQSKMVLMKLNTSGQLRN